MADEFRDELERKLAQAKELLEQRLLGLRNTLKQTEHKHFEQVTKGLRSRIEQFEKNARDDFDKMILEAEKIPNPVTRKVYEDSLRTQLESTISFQQRLLLDQIERL